MGGAAEQSLAFLMAKAVHNEVELMLAAYID